MHYRYMACIRVVHSLGGETGQPGTLPDAAPASALVRKLAAAFLLQ